LRSVFVVIKKLLLLLGLVVVAGIGYIAVIDTVEPSFAVEVGRANDRYRLTIEPNFVVNEILQVRVTGPQGLLVESSPQRSGERREAGKTEAIDLPLGLAAGNEVVVECNLQYDRLFSANATTKTVKLVLP